MFIANRDANEGSSVYSQFSSMEAVIGSRAINQSSVSALTFLVWDILITLDDEIRLMWPHTLSWMKLVYFTTRYLAFLGQIPLLLVGSELSPDLHFTPQQCFLWQVYQGVLASLVVVAADVILIVRVRAMYRGHPLVPKVVTMLFILEILGMAIGLGLSLPGIKWDNMCIVVHIPFQLGIYGIGSITLQTALFALTLYKFVKDVKYYEGWRGIPLTVLLLRDGTWAFILLFCVYLGQVALYVAQTPDALGILFPWMLTLSSFCGYRIIHNLRWFAVDGSEERIADILEGVMVEEDHDEGRNHTIT